MSLTLVDFIKQQEPLFVKAATDDRMVWAKECQFAIQLFQNNKYLADIAFQNQASTQNAIINVAAIGISLNPAQKLAYLVPRKGAICLDISYMGLMHIAQQSGAIKWCQSAIVRKNDQFRREGLDKPPVHVYNDFDTAEQRGEIVGAYVVVKTDDGDYLTHTMRIADIYAIRDRSEAWKKYKQDSSKKCPWVTDEEQMILKTVVKQATKYWPRRERLDAAIDHVNTEGEEGINFAAERQPERDITPASLDTLKEINDLLIAMNKTWDEDLLPLCRRIFKRDILESGDLTEIEAVKALGFLKQRAAA
ncbi:recombinase RecT [Leclercia adecarboxylata]|uniref:Recombinase RecT n=1 Tax=Leclercia adecarboxylata TaxID=83655 RepID=A0A9X3YA83_9ENTR|nr:recombinase RecT [Leclercia adecarboxylata]MBD1404272.1 recombinase RecT [Leclercia adecarboxylata]MDC6621901.1 recombinase RecT [Leclercia adecarboxylata]MDC6632973.1 recombinase RecT [Leclercia adecarboxylata]MDC6638269.1 recombinase RecT [Leclercia adecarboxylata]MDC6649012.1 recombinase RecT [Leclercia adecarboxylata]